MNINQKNFLSIINNSIHNKSVTLMEPVDYEGIIKIARAHNLIALVGEQLCQTPEFATQPLFEKVSTMSMAVVAIQSIKTDNFLNLYKAFLEEDIHPIVMKGIICRQLYGDLSNHRPSGDEDILIQKSEFDKAKDILINNGYIPEIKEVTPKYLEELQEISFVNEKNGLTIEFHFNPIGRENSLRIKMNDYFDSVFDDSIEFEIDQVPIRTMNHTDEFLFLALHTFKHMCTAGFGIRQVLDILLYMEKYNDEIHWEYIKQALKDIGAYSFFQDILYIGDKYLGFNTSFEYEANCPEDLLEDIFESGVFGNETQAQVLASRMTGLTVTNKDRKVGFYVRNLFPGKKYFMVSNPEILEKPYILPILWMKRWFKFLKKNRKESGKLAQESMEISKRRTELLKKYDII